jgi:cyclic beta-1,2-glucan synthetase
LNVLQFPSAKQSLLHETADAPIRAEIFGVERLEQHAESLATSQRVTARAVRGLPLDQRLRQNTEVLTQIYRAIVTASRDRQSIPPAADWLLDNFHIVDEQIREIKDDLPPGYYRKLPKLAEGPLQGFPRVAGIAWAVVAHTDSAFDIERLTRFVAAYQRVQPLTIGELWAVAITLRIILVENLRRLAEMIGTRLSARQLADKLADQIMGTDATFPEPVEATLAALERTPWSPAFAAQLAQRLRDHDPETTPALRWLNDKIAAVGTTTEQIAVDDVAVQSATNVTVRNVITSMRLVSTANWTEFFESVSPVDAVMRAGSDFGAMDFSTRDLYRRAIESLALGSGRKEIDVASRAVTAAKTAAKQASGSIRERDPGYYLISKGRRGFEHEIGCRVGWRTRLFRLNSRLGVMSYVGMIGFVTAIILAIALTIAGQFGAETWAFILLAVTGLLPASDVATAIVNRIVTQQIGAVQLPGLELAKGVPSDLRTLVVVPTMLTSVRAVDALVERLEVHHLANPDDNFTFALLSDWPDAVAEHAPDDEKTLALAAAGIARLNAQYGPASDGGARFFLLHRRRCWSAGEGRWLGWERKRGKLHELNKLLRGAVDTTFLPIGGRPPAVPANVRYVITLDSDTRLPLGAARRLVGKIAHPLNRPVFDPKVGRVVQGHGILQPRVTPSLPIGSQGSLFQRVYSGPNGLDPYALAVSDIYQDMFEEGSYCGKGIYDVDTFTAAVEGQIPENAVLSHDLLEGVLTRAGLVTDIEVVEEFPSRYDVAAARQHRWVRGDWQLLPWIFEFKHKASDGSRKPLMPLMGRWKMFDNLRRSLSAPSALLALLVAWSQPVAPAIVWTTFILLTIILPPFLPLFAGLIPRRPGVTIRNHLRGLGGDLALGLSQSIFLITFLAHQAWLMVDAVFRSLFRMVVRRRLLEWVTAAQAESEHRFDHRRLLVQVGGSLVFAGGVAIVLRLSGNSAWPIAVPFALLWVASPFIARWASLPPPSDGQLPLSSENAGALRLIARRTWRYFERFVTAEDNMLPPDNFQETPDPVVAHRTSPTNIGLYLLSVVAAHDFGWLGTLDATDRLEATFATLEKMERFRGHYYNWYDTRDLRPLDPRYISSVDSGNLAGHLIALGNACRDIAAACVCNPHLASGVRDNLDLVREAVLAQVSVTSGTAQPAPAPVIAALDNIAGLLRDSPEGLGDWTRRLTELKGRVDRLDASVRGGSGDQTTHLDVELQTALDGLNDCIASHQRDLEQLVPWSGRPAGADPITAEAAALDAAPALSGLADHCQSLLDRLSAAADQPTATPSRYDLTGALEKATGASRLLVLRLTALAERCTAMFDGMEFGFLLDVERELLSIGYRAADGSLDSNCYDLLASEARLASFIAIAKGDLPARHWFRLGRTLTPIDAGSGLISWSGSMFEYLMPSLVMRAPSGSLLEGTNRLAVRRQESYAKSLGVPWGMSESQYNARDIEKTYQYSSFGVPDLGYKRGLSDNIVIAPYASGLGAMVDPAAASRNYERMAGLGASGLYGWYEAIDYTPSRLPDDAKFAIVRAYMAHHQAMSIVGIANALQDGRMRTRFHAEPIVQAAELLLQERMPRDVAMARPPPEQARMIEAPGATPETQRHYDSAHSRVPRTHILSNGSYSAMVTASGSGYSRWRDVAITRWREDVTRDAWGAYVFLRDVRSGQTWSAGYQPTVTEPNSYEVTFAEDRAEILRTDEDLTTSLEVMVSPEDDAEVRRVSITNHGSQTREIELTSYAEIALARQADDVAHPAFAKLFVETEFVASPGVILATRRRRSSGDPQVWAAHLAVVEGESAGEVQFETDRARFLGRGQTVRSAATITDGWPLSNTCGPVLDPVFSLRRRVTIPRGATVRVAFWTMAAATRDEVLALADRHHDAAAFERAAALAWTQGQMWLHHLGINLDQANVFQRLANHVLYSDPVLRPTAEALKPGLRKVSTLWAQGISGDRPIIVARVEQDDDLNLVRELLRAHEYWRLKRLDVDLVIVNERASSYIQDLQIAIEALVRTNQGASQAPHDGLPGAVFALRADLISPEVRSLLYASARAVLHGDRGTLAEQLNQARNLKPGSAPPKRPRRPLATPELSVPRPESEFFNGLGGFIADGSEYLTTLEGGDHTPAPWINVISNPEFGFQVSTEGSGFTWSINSQQNQLTPWSNDSVSDPAGEALYVTDEDTGEVWTPTALPIREPAGSYAVRHGQGYSRFDYVAHGIALELLQYVPVKDSIKIVRLKISNQSGRARRLSITAYLEWVLGASRISTAPFVVTEIDPVTGAILAQNPWSDQFGERVAFADLGGRQTSWTCDRTEFLGRDGAMDWPRALTPGTRLSDRAGPGLDPCAALQTQVRLGMVETTEIVFLVGQAATREEARALIAKYRAANLDAVLAEVTQQWDDVLGAVQIKTPDRALDILVNRWLPYQTLACRVWARTGFYQASGAYGFRDQLQDVMALCLSRPDIVRAHLLRAAGRQFVEGDVQHWWLPESGNGIRTRISDDRPWLAYVVDHYVITTGDTAVLEVEVPFLEGPVLQPGQHDAFFAPKSSSRTASLYDHCALALDTSLGVGAHGLPLMGTGDWNDGMDRVGEGGKGESVWLAWFQHKTLTDWATLAEARGDLAHAVDWRRHAQNLSESLERAAWDGDWYRRAYFDDGTPLGSVSNSECRIDSITQSWAVLSGAGDPARAARAMAAVDKYLIRRDDKLALLFTPPFVNPSHDPGYINGYPAGIRENGGQYTHAATWTAMAFAMQGDGDRAGELLSMLNPIHHADSPAGMRRYRVEPYVVCADVYSEAPHTARGGWTWYTGSAAWLYRATLEGMLGFRAQGDHLLIDPCIPRTWPSFEIVYRHRTARYVISVENPLGVCRGIIAIKLDGEMLPAQRGLRVPLIDDGATHQLQIVLG